MHGLLRSNVSRRTVLMTGTSVIGVAMFVRLLCGGAAAEVVKIGSVEIPADSPLARKEHPRLLFTRAELPAIRRRAALPGVRADLG